jgi:hypothetical protein
VTENGVIDELDKGRLTFILRQTIDGKDKVFTFTDEFFDDVIIAFNSSTKVALFGRQVSVRQPIELLGIESVSPVKDSKQLE